MSLADRVTDGDGGEPQGMALPAHPGPGVLGEVGGGCCRVTSFPESTTPTCGFSQSSSENPTARSIALAPARAGPRVTS
jgi:hypothetical protein